MAVLTTMINGTVCVLRCRDGEMCGVGAEGVEGKGGGVWGAGGRG